MTPVTPETIGTLQRKLHRKAKQEPGFRFHAWYDKIHRADIPGHAYDLVRSNRGAPGTDGVSFEAIEAGEGKAAFVAGPETEPGNKAHRARPVRRVRIPESHGERRPPGIPANRDRVVRMAVKLVVEPIFEADFHECS